MTVKPVGMEVESMRTATTICRWEEISKFGITEKVVNGGIFSQKKITLISKRNLTRSCKENLKTHWSTIFSKLPKHFKRTYPRKNQIVKVNSV